MSSYGNELLGFDPFPVSLTGLSWKAQLAEKIFSETGDKKLKALGVALKGEHGWDISVIDKLIANSARTLLPGADRITALAATVKVTPATAKSFLQNINSYRNKATTKSIVGVTGKVLADIAEGAGGIAKGAGDTSKALPWILGILALGVGSYLMFAGKRGVNLIPSLKIGQ